MIPKKLQIDLNRQFSEIKSDCKFKKCLFPDKSKCSERIIKAHSIQKNKILKKIAEKGMLVTSNMNKMLFSKEFEKVGINSASTFFGFCGYHDTVIFSQIENKDFTGRSEQNFLFSYRASSIEFVKKKIASCIYKKLVAQTQDNQIINQIMKNNMLGSEYGMKDLEVILKKFSNELCQPKEDRNYEIITTLIFKFPYEAFIAVNSCFALEYDFDGYLINDLRNTSKIPAHVFLNIFPQKGKTYILLSCLSENKTTYSDIFTEIKSMPNSRKEIFFSNMIISHCENFFMCPSKYYKIPKKARRLMVSRYIKTMQSIESNNIKRGSINLFKKLK